MNPDLSSPLPASRESLRVLFSCSGVGVLNRGIETFFREAFDGLRGLAGVESRLLKGAGPTAPDEQAVWNLSRTGPAARCVGVLAHRSGYVVEQWSTFFPAVRYIRRFQPQVIFYSDANLGFLLYRFRRRIGVPFRLLFSNGGPCHPPFVRTDFVHQVSPFCYQEALAAGEPADKHFLVPYGISVPDRPPAISGEEKLALRRRLKLPTDRPVVLSVGWISATHKRMDYTIREIARLPEPRPFLQLLGAMDESSGEIVDLGCRLLGPHGFGAASVAYDEVAPYYQAADGFVLASLEEGFGRVFLESLMYGLPTIAHRHPVMEYVLGDEGCLGDLREPGALTRLVESTLAAPADAVASRRRWESVRQRFGWQSLRPRYRDMFIECAQRAVPELS